MIEKHKATKVKEKELKVFWWGRKMKEKEVRGIKGNHDGESKNDEN